MWWYLVLTKLLGCMWMESMCFNHQETVLSKHELIEPFCFNHQEAMWANMNRLNHFASTTKRWEQTWGGRTILFQPLKGGLSKHKPIEPLFFNHQKAVWGNMTWFIYFASIIKRQFKKTWMSSIILLQSSKRSKQTWTHWITLLHLPKGGLSKLEPVQSLYFNCQKAVQANMN